MACVFALHFKVKQHGLVTNYEVQLARTLDGIDFKRPLPPLWNEFDSLGRVPLMVVRGENSHILSKEMLDAMRVAVCNADDPSTDERHVPLLARAETNRRILSFIASCKPSKLQ